MNEMNDVQSLDNDLTIRTGIQAGDNGGFLGSGNFTGGAGDDTGTFGGGAGKSGGMIGSGT